MAGLGVDVFSSSNAFPGGGGSGTPGGVDTQVQFNDLGAFGGDAGLTFNKTTGVLSVGKKLSIAAGTTTVSAPVLDLSQTWNAGAVTFTGLKLNVTDTASAAASKLLDVQVGGASKFSVSKAGVITLPWANQDFVTNGVVGFGANGANATISSGGLQLLANSNGVGVVSLNIGGDLYSPDLRLFRDAANILAQRNSTNAQTFRVYNTYTDASNYERGKIAWAANVLQVGTEKAGTGTARALALQTDGTTRLTVEAAGGLTVADANNIAVGTTTGTKIGTATQQKIGFYNATPVVQPAAVADATGAGDVVAQLNLLLSRMRDLGLIAP